MPSRLSMGLSLCIRLPGRESLGSAGLLPMRSCAPAWRMQGFPPGGVDPMAVARGIHSSDVGARDAIPVALCS